MSGRSRQETRRSVKATISGEDARRKREETSRSLRQSKKDEVMLKRRHFTEELIEEATTSSPIPTLEELPMILDAVRSDNVQRQLQGTRQIRKLLSVERNPPIDDVIATGVIPTLVQYLTVNHLPDLQFEAAWALTNIASGTSKHTLTVVESGAVPQFINMMSSFGSSEELKEQAIWAIGNIAGDSPALRDLCIDLNAIPSILGTLEGTTRISLLRNATWTLSNMCRGKPEPNLAKVQLCLPALAKLANYTDEEILTDACWALSYLSDGSNQKIQAVIDTGIVPRLVSLLGHSSTTVITPALRTVGNIVTGDDSQTQHVLSVGVLKYLSALLRINKRGIQKETCWLISNVTAGTATQIQAVIEAGVMPEIISLLEDGALEVKREASWALSNATCAGNVEQIHTLVKMGCLKPICSLLDCSDSRIITVLLDALENILKAGKTWAEKRNLSSKGVEESNPFANLVEEYDGLDKLEGLQTHHQEEIYNKTIKILENYFQTEDENENTMPVQSTPNSFQFTGVPTFSF